jgi:hypothetical protein
LTTNRFLALLGSALVCVLAGYVLLARAEQGLSRPPGGTITTVTPQAGFFTEPSVAINPVNPQQIAAAFQDNASVAYSQDGGTHWQIAAGTAPPNYKVSGDVSIAYDLHGHAILCFIAFDKLGTAEYWAHNATRNGIFVRRSLDGGSTWEAQAIAIDEQPTRAVMPFEDKPYIVADNNPQSPFAGNLYVGWTEFSLTKTIILFSRSVDGGSTWSSPIEISTQEGLPRDDNGAVEGFTGTVTADGTLSVAWSAGNWIAMATSNDGGRTFTPSRKIIETGPSYFNVENVQRSNGFPQIGSDPRSSALFVAWSDYRNGDVDVFCATSADKGKSWSREARVNDDPIHNGTDQFFQWMAVDPADGSVNLIFYDRRGDPQNKVSTITLARSQDGGKVFTNYAWDTRPFDSKGGFIGDYTGIAALGGRVFGVWTSGEQHPPADSSAPKTRTSFGLKSHLTVVNVGSADFSHSGGSPE